MSDFELVSVITPCFNDGQYLPDAIASVECCDRSQYELIIVDDGSTDPVTVALLHKLEFQGYQIIRQRNQGLAAARNAGIMQAKGRYILPLDADNKIRPNYIPIAIQLLNENPDLGVVYGDRKLFGERDEIIRVREFDFSWMLSGNYIDACAVFRRTIWEECGGYDTRMPIAGFEDWDLWLTFAEKGWKFEHVSAVLFDYRFRERSMRSTMDIQRNKQLIYEYIMRKHASSVWREYLKFATLETPARELRRQPFYLLSKLFLLAYFPTLAQRLKKGRNNFIGE